ncbi:MAG: hypothetical protein IJ347_03810 [Faecalibacterium sp.]|nr:hypothetical protein [Faecalibacterium sp.]
MDTLKMHHNGTVKMIAHRGVSGLERENTAAAFVAAGNRSYYGIETDIHETADGRFIIIHDDNTLRVSGRDCIVEQTDYETLRGIHLLDRKSESTRADLVLPSLEEYISICQRYEKIAVLELKNEMKPQTVLAIARVIEQMGYLDQTIFISFAIKNLIALRAGYPDANIQYLVERIDDLTALIETLKQYRFDIDAKHNSITAEMIPQFHQNGIRINVWTVNTVERAERLQELGVDYITTNIVE